MAYPKKLHGPPWMPRTGAPEATPRAQGDARAALTDQQVVRAEIAFRAEVHCMEAACRLGNASAVWANDSGIANHKRAVARAAS
eukprot:13519726-Alexandrium_andersonii.AAC.1